MGADSSAHFVGNERFEVVDCLGSGGMGTVYKVLDRDTDAIVALKVLEVDSRDALLLFRREFRAIQGISHPNLIRLGELEQSDGRWFYTMELVDGEDFLTHVAARDDESRPFDETRLRRALAQLFGGLAALHAGGKVHRDVKPSNVVVTPSGRLVIVDFGFVVDVDNPDRLSLSDEVVGTAAYMAPEQLEPGAAGPAADCYAAGIMLYEALTGAQAYAGSSIEVLMHKQQRGPRPISELVDGVPFDLERLCEDLLRRAPDARPSSADVLRRLGATSPSATTPAPRVEDLPVFVGRDNELAVLLDSLRAPRAPRTIVVEGSSGVGKTALVRRFVELAAQAEPGLMVFHGQCYERESVPFKGVEGVVESIAVLLRDLPTTEVMQLIPRRAPLLLQVFPALGRVEAFRRLTPGHEAVSPLELRRRVFSTLRHLVSSLAERGPVVLQIDDMQWASADSWAMLEYLMNPLEAPPVILVLTTRDDGTSNDGARWRPPLSGDVDRIQLDTLGYNEALALARALLERADHDTAAAAELAREAEGHPFFIQQLVAHVVGGGRSGSGVARLEDALHSRILALAPEARMVLRLIATAGAPLPHVTIATAGRLEFADYERCVADLSAATLVRTTGARATDTIAHYHDRIREAALTGVRDDDRALLHRRIANALEDGGLAEGAPEFAAYHLAAAGHPERAAFHAEIAARRARDVLAFEQASRLYLTALELGAYNESQRRELSLQLAEALVNDGRGVEAAKLFLAAARTGSASERLDFLRRAAEQLLFAGYLDEGIEVLSEVLSDIGEKLPVTPRRALLSLVWQRFVLRLRGLRWRARSPSEIAPRELVSVDVYQSVGMGLALVDNVRGSAYQAKFLRKALALGEPARVIRGAAFEAALLSGVCARRRAKRLAAMVSEWAEDNASPMSLAFSHLAAAGAHFYMDNDWRATHKECDAAEHLLRTHAQSAGWETATARMFRCFALLHMGELSRLSRLLPVYLRDAQRRGDNYASVSLRARLVVAALIDDDPEAGREEVDEAIGQWAPWRSYYTVQHFFALHSMCELALYAGDAAGAARHIDEQLGALKRSQLLRIWFPRGEVDHLRGRIALAAAAHATGTERAHHVANARRFARRLRKNKLEAARGWSHLVAAGARRLAGDTEGAAAELEEATRRLDANHSVMYATVARGVLGRELGGARGDALRVQCDEWMREQGVVDPDALTALLVPGFG